MMLCTVGLFGDGRPALHASATLLHDRVSARCMNEVQISSYPPDLKVRVC